MQKTRYRIEARPKDGSRKKWMLIDVQDTRAAAIKTVKEWRHDGASLLYRVVKVKTVEITAVIY